MFLTAQQLQNAADGASLAGAQKVFNGPAPAYDAAAGIAAENYAGGKTVGLAANLDNLPDGDVVVGVYDRPNRTFTPIEAPEDYANAVKVLARRTTGSPQDALPLFFGPIFGKNTAEVSRDAIAIAEGGPAHSDIIALNADDPMSFYIYGDAYLNVGNGEGSVQVNSSDTTNNVGASLIQGTNVQFLAGEVNIVGAQYERGKPSLPETNEGEPYEQDPLRFLPEPEVPETATYPATPMITGVTEFHPGYYPGGIDLKAGDNVFLHPGVYILDTGFYINGHATLTGYGVMFYLNQGSVHDNGTGQVYVTPPSTGVYKDIQFFQARDNTETAEFNGGTIWDGAQNDDLSTPDVDESTIGAGTFYFPAASIEMGGTGDITFNGLIADKVEVYGSGNVNVTGGYESNKGRANVYLVQ